MDRGIVLGGMSKVVTARYDAEHNVLRLAEPLEGFDDHENVEIVVHKTPVSPDPLRPWLAYSGILSKEDGDDLAKALEILQNE